jgi:GntR family transcriptional regulator
VILFVNLESALPPYEQIRAQITGMAASGVLPSGTRLPTIRQLSADLGLAPGTVSRAFRELEAAGVVSTRGRHGTFIAARPTLSPSERAARLALAAAAYAQAAGQLGASERAAIQALTQALSCRTVERKPEHDALGLPRGYPPPDIIGT